MIGLHRVAAAFTFALASLVVWTNATTHTLDTVPSTPTGAPAGSVAPHVMRPYHSGSAPSVITGPLVYNGGLLQSAPVVYVVYWGWTSDPFGEQAYLNDFLNTVGGTPWLNTVMQYAGGSPPSLYAGSWSDTSAIPAQPSDGQIQAEAAAALTHFGLGTSVNIQIVVATPTGHSTPGFGTTFCAYHGAVAGHPNVTYTNLPYMTDAGSTCGENLVQGPLDGVSIVEGHELAESITDPIPHTGWADAGNNEIGDKCAWTNLSKITTSLGTFAVQPLWSNLANGCALSTSYVVDRPNLVYGQNNLDTIEGFDLSAGIGSISPNKTSNGYTYQLIEDHNAPPQAGGSWVWSGIALSGFSSDPGSQWLSSLQAGPGDRVEPAASASYNYASGTASWRWTTTGPLPVTGGVVTIVHQ